MNASWLIAAIAALAAALIGYLLGTLRAAKRAAEAQRQSSRRRAPGSPVESETRERNAELLRQSEAQVAPPSRALRASHSTPTAKPSSSWRAKCSDATRPRPAPRSRSAKKPSSNWSSRSRWRSQAGRTVEGAGTRTAGVRGQDHRADRKPGEGPGALQRETRNLSTALRRPEVRGRWGELTLRRVVELSGMSEHCDFTEQEPGRRRRRGALRPDLLVRMPESREHRRRCQDAARCLHGRRRSAGRRSAQLALGRHAQQVEQRVRELGQKSYWEQFEDSPEFAVLFLPGDQFLSAALAERPDLIDYALKQRIIVTTPSTLMALLKVDRLRLAADRRHGERRARSANSARTCTSGSTTFVNHLQKVGRSLGNAVESFNAAVGSIERNVMPQARKFTELGATTDACHRTGRPDRTAGAYAGGADARIRRTAETPRTTS